MSTALARTGGIGAAQRDLAGGVDGERAGIVANRAASSALSPTVTVPVPVPLPPTVALP